MVDRFVWGSVSRISPEAPVPVVRLDRETSCLGGAGNVVRNVLSLGGRAVAVGVRGDDEEGARLEALMREDSIPTEGVVVARGRSTTVKTRVIAQHQQVVRVDRESDEALPVALTGLLIERAAALLPRSAAVVVSDYDKGVVSKELLQAILPKAAALGLPIVVDPKVPLFPHYRPATVVTPNAREAAEAAGIALRADTDFEAVGRRLLDLLGCPWLLITRGDRGMLLLEKSGESTVIGAAARDVFDVTGAGDTVVATLGLCLAGGAGMLEGAILANRAAGVVVGKVGTASITADELVAAAEAPSPGR